MYINKIISFTNNVSNSILYVLYYYVTYIVHNITDII